MWFDASYILILVPLLLQKLKYLRYKLEESLEKLYLYIQTFYIYPYFLKKNFLANHLCWICSEKYLPLVYGLTYLYKTSLQIKITRLTSVVSSCPYDR